MTPYNLNYPAEWERLFQDTRDMVVNLGDDDIDKRRHIRIAWDRIVKEKIPQPRDPADSWKRCSPSEAPDFYDEGEE
jgi:hypothetical protein